MRTSLTAKPNSSPFPGHYSTVRLELWQEADGSKLSLTQTEVPEADAARTSDGWRKIIFEGLKRTFGFGASLM